MYVCAVQRGKIQSRELINGLTAAPDIWNISPIGRLEPFTAECLHFYIVFHYDC